MANFSKFLEIINGTPKTVDLSQAASVLTLGQGGLQFNDGSTGDFVMKAASSIPSPYTIIWPAAQAASSGYVLTNDGTGTLSWSPAAAAGVTSVAFADGSSTPIFTVTGSPVTSTGTLTNTLKTQTANTVFAGPSSGSAAQPGFRSLVAADIPSLSAVYANLTLSNLTSPTAVNQDLLPGTNGGESLGSTTKVWLSLYAEGIRVPTGNQVVVDVTNRTLIDAGTNLSVDWENHFLYDVSPLKSIDYTNRLMYATDGTTAVVDWGDQVLEDTSGALSVDWQNRLLSDSGSATQLSWSTSGITINTVLSLNGSTSGAITQQASATTTPYTITWPAAQAASSGLVLSNDGTGILSWASASSGSVTSVAFADASSTPIYTISGSPVTSTGTLTQTLTTQTANFVFAGPASGSAAQPSFRALVIADLSFAGNANGVATLDSGGHIPLSQLPSTIVEYKGTWNANTNTPTLANGTGISGWFYIVSVAGTTDFGAGPITFNAGDWVLYNGTIWEQAVQSNIVQSVNGQTGVVTVNAINQLTGDITAGPASGSASAASSLVATTNATLTTLSGLTTASALVTVGTITSGTWSATAIGPTHGGTGQSTYATGDTLYASATNVLSKLTIGSTGNVLTVSGGIPTWAPPATGGTVTTVSVVSTNGFAGTVATATSTPVITISTTVNSPVLAGNGTAISAATTTGTGSTVVLSASPALTGTVTAANATLSGKLVAPTLQVTGTYNGTATLAANTTYAFRYGIPANSETTNDFYVADWNTTSFDLFWVIGLFNSGTTTATGASVTVTNLGSFTLASSDTNFGTSDQGKPVWLGTSGAYVPNSTFTPAAGDANEKLGIVTSATTIWVDCQMMGVS